MMNDDDKSLETGRKEEGKRTTVTTTTMDDMALQYGQD